ncbi:MAG: YihY family inner membrane protein [Sterolibacterium sp.]|nr:YihY family inner membrane protein [Sterolibacterium sp.]MBP9799565.1 YihY family inner membrane protein [Sterolibacterium sp.]
MLLVPFRLVVRIVRRFREERCMQVAASLSFSTLMGLVPLVAMGVVLLAYLPFSADVALAIKKFLLANLLPDKAGKIIARYIEQFAHKTERLTLVGGGILAVTALMQMLTIERTFNVIWRVKAERPLLRRLWMHLLAMFLGPVLFGGGLAGIGYLAGISLGLFNESQWLNALFFRGAPLVIMTVLFALLYYTVPNREVNRWHALLGGVLATAGFTLMQRLFSAYVTSFPTYTVIYGAFSVIPIFLVWLHMSWSVVLAGALMVAELPEVLKGSVMAAGRQTKPARRSPRRGDRP